MKASELLPLAIDWLGAAYPGSLIVPELSIGSWGAALIDVAAITETEIIGIEIKGEGDSPARMPLQASIYSKAATRMYLLPCPDLEARCFKHIPGAWGRLVVREGLIERVLTRTDEWYRDHPFYAPVRRKGDPAEMLCTAPAQLLQCLWRDELDTLARLEAIITGKVDVETLRWMIAEAVPIAKLRAHVCWLLRHRKWSGERGTKYVIWSPQAEAA